jgi:hypothetical protein
MDNDFLDGIDEQFQRLMKLNGTGKGNGRQSVGRSKEDSLAAEIIDHLRSLSESQKEQVLTLIRTMEKQKVD